MSEPRKCLESLGRVFLSSFEITGAQNDFRATQNMTFLVFELSFAIFYFLVKNVEHRF